MMKNSYKNFRLASLAFWLILKSVKGPDLASKIVLSYLRNFSSSVRQVPHNSFPYQKHGEKSR